MWCYQDYSDRPMRKSFKSKDRSFLHERSFKYHNGPLSLREEDGAFQLWGKKTKPKQTNKQNNPFKVLGNSSVINPPLKEYQHHFILALTLHVYNFPEPLENYKHYFKKTYLFHCH